MSNVFDPSNFLNSGLQATDRKLVPQGVYSATIAELKAKGGTSEKTGKPWARLDVVCDIDSESVREATGRGTNKLTFGLMLDIAEDGSVAFVKGSRLDKLRKSLGATEEPFTPASLQGRMCKVQVEHELYNDNINEKISSILPAY